MSENQPEVTADQSAESGPTAAHLASGPIILTIVAVIACVLAALAIPSFHPLNELPEKLGDYGTGASDELVQEAIDEQNKLDLKNDLAVLALIGGCIASAVGFVEGLAQRSLIRAGIGLVLGAALGAGGGALGAEIAYGIQSELDVFRADAPIQNTIAMHCGVWVPVGLAIGMTAGAAATNLGLILKCGVGGAIGGGLASTLYPIIAAYAMPGARVNTMYSHNLPSAQWLWLLLAAVMIAGITGAIGGEQKPKTQKPT